MPALYFIEIVLIGIGIWLLVFQILFPLMTGKPLFPVFRGWRTETYNKLAEAEESLELAKVEKAAAATERDAEAIRKSEEKPGEPDSN